MKKHFAMGGIALLLAACSHEGGSPSSKSDWGTGLNTIERKYNKPASDTYDAALSALKSFELTVDRDRHDDMGGDAVGLRGDGSKVTIKVTAIDKGNSSASVRVDPGNSSLATMIHEKIADKLGMAAAKAAFFGGNTEDFPYDADLVTGIDAAEKTVKALNWSLTGKEVKDSEAWIDARAEDSNPVRIRIERTNDRAFPLKATFIAGHGNVAVSKQLIDRMHEEFDRHLGGHVR
jgi:hypothetical protein